MKVKIFGDSHIKALVRGWEHLRVKEGDTRDLNFDFYASHGRYWPSCKVIESDTSFRLSQVARGHPKLEDYVVEKNGGFYFFSSPLHSSPMHRHRIWKTCCPWICVQRDPELQALSSTVIQRWADKHVRRRIELLEKLQAGGISVAVIEPPKPLKRTPKMFGIRADIVSAVSRIYRDHVFSLLDNRGISVIRAPTSTYEETGFTKSIFAPKKLNDYHHGNVLFGCEVIKEIIRFVDESGQRAGVREPLERDAV